MTHSQQNMPPRGRRLTTVLAIGAAALTTLALTSLLHARAALQSPQSQVHNLPVATVTWQRASGYLQDREFLGLVRAREAAAIAFERDGLIATLPARIGDRVRAGDEIARLDTSRLDAQRRELEAERRRIEAELELAGRKADRFEQLRETGAVSEQLLDEATLAARALEAQLGAVEARLDSLAVELDKSVLRAPYDGELSQRHVDVGTVVGAGTPVVSVVASGAREAHVGIPAELVRELVSGELYAVSLGGRPTQARLRSVSPDIDQATLMATAVFELPAGESALAGETVVLELPVSVPTEGGWLPMTALQEGRRGLWSVLRIAEDVETGQSVTVREAVEVLHAQDDRVYVRGTLQDGARVIASGLHRLAAGSPVTPVEGTPG